MLRSRYLVLCLVLVLFVGSLYGQRRKKEEEFPEYTPPAEYTTTEDVTRLSKTAYFSGTLTDSGDVIIEGTFEGELNVMKTLTVKPSGVVNASKMTVNKLIAEGKVSGPVTATDKVELRAGSDVRCDIVCKRFVVEEGAIFNGSCKMEVGTGGTPAGGTGE